MTTTTNYLAKWVQDHNAVRCGIDFQNENGHVEHWIDKDNNQYLLMFLRDEAPFIFKMAS